ncbi:class A beta-lactamase [Nocardioides sp. C4-1]|uniref:class A beta-lactamase n=1 Tax=Nocardioides sp. C4-1 TaxID=3151851 RepID=UPI003264E50C
MLVRRGLVLLVLPVLLGCAAEPSPDTPPPSSPGPTSPSGSAGSAPPASPADVAARLRALEREFAARVGVSVVDTGGGPGTSYRGGARFGHASTIKAFAAAAFLRLVPEAERGEVVRWTAADLAEAGYAPVTEQHLDAGLPLERLAEAAVRESDNLAYNLVLERIGGPPVLDDELARLGDDVTEVVSFEDELNDIEPGSTADTTTADAFAGALADLVTGEHLAGADRALLLDWMSGNVTGDALIRAGAPDGWDVADKSGGAGGLRNDVAVVTPPDDEPLVVVVLTEKRDPDADYDDALVARVAEVVLG